MFKTFSFLLLVTLFVNPVILSSQEPHQSVLTKRKEIAKMLFVVSVKNQKVFDKAWREKDLIKLLEVFKDLESRFLDVVTKLRYPIKDPRWFKLHEKKQKTINNMEILGKKNELTRDRILEDMEVICLSLIQTFECMGEDILNGDATFVE